MGEHFDPNLMLDTENRTLRNGILNISRTNGRIFVANSITGRSASEIEPAGNAAVASTSSASTTQTASTQSAASGKTTGAASGTIHTVKKGDTLYSISKRYGTTIDNLCRINGISRNGVLSIGQKIKVK